VDVDAVLGVGAFNQTKCIGIVNGGEKKKRMRNTVGTTLTIGQHAFFFWLFGIER